MRDPKERLRDMMEAIAAIERHVTCGRAAFQQDELALAPRIERLLRRLEGQA